ncbi:MAG TPA: AAA domain-containing protein [Methanomassiliicoccales archaeon]|jgi:hypothetical protein
MSEEIPQIIVTDIGEYIDKGCCARNFKLRLDKGMEARRFPFFPAVRKPLNPILAMNGQRLEDQWAEDFSKTMTLINPPISKSEKGEITWTDFLERIKELPPGHSVFAREVEIYRQIGSFRVTGRMDFLLFRWDGQTPVLRIVECKASRKDKTYHRIQLAAYRLMVMEALAEGKPTLDGFGFKDIRIESVVARIDEKSNQNQDALTIPSLDLEEEMDDLRQLLSNGGPFVHVQAAPLEQLNYRLEPKCDSCQYCPICLPESARLRRVELIGIDQSTTNTLIENGIDTIDDLADLDRTSEKAQALVGSPGFNMDLGDLIVRAKARRSTLKGRQEGDWGIIPRPNPGKGQLPVYQSGTDSRLIRVYLDVEYEYIENRLAALSAHVTDSELPLVTRSEKVGEKNRYDPVPMELDRETGQSRPCVGTDVVNYISKPWTGDHRTDDEKEGQMVQDFFDRLADAIADVGKGEDMRPVHFYVWSKNDMTHLIDACSRVGGPLLHNLTELLGSRERCQGPMEQLIFTPLRDEIDQKVALGYTGHSLAIATSLGWFGFPKFHWTRKVEGVPTDLSYSFRRDIFDFRTSLNLNSVGQWCERNDPDGHPEFFEIRTKFGSDINAPYWYALWGILPEPGNNLDKVLLNDYRRGGKAPLIAAFLQAKCQALRWLEERLSKNDGIQKPLMPINDLKHIDKRFEDRYDLVNACLDFMRLDHHVKKVEWVTSCLRSPSTRVAEGFALPLKDLIDVPLDDNSHVVRGVIDLERYAVDPDVFFSVCMIGEESFVRISPYSGKPDEGQSIHEVLSKGVTGKVTFLDRKTGLFAAKVITTNYKDPIARDYVLPSLSSNAAMPYALVEEGISAFVQNRVDEWLRNHRNAPAVRWFDPGSPAIPLRDQLTSETKEACRNVLRSMRVLDRSLDEVQVQACIDGMEGTVQLLLGPPGTGKTNTTAAAILLRLASTPERKLFLLSANTHTAVDELTERLRLTLPSFRKASAENGFRDNPVSILRLKDEPSSAEEITFENINQIKDQLSMNDVVICGSVNEVLKLGKNMDKSGWPLGSAHASGLIVDEASMMLFPDFLALATMVSAKGEIMLTGDHMQLSPITSHDWENEDREQIVRLTPHESAYVTVKRLCSRCDKKALRQSELTLTYRLTDELIHLISDVYKDEGVTLTSKKTAPSKSGRISSLSDVWRYGGIYLIVHDESSSRKLNEFEAGLIQDVIASRPGSKKDIEPGSISIITPHRAQKGALKSLLMEDHGDQIKMIDTVERLQGGECETIIVSGTQSDMNAIGDSAEFILNLNRTNVIFSRAKERLIVVCSRNLLDSVPADIDDYRSSWLWKRLRSTCDTEMLKVEGYEHEVSVRVPGRFWNK